MGHDTGDSRGEGMKQNGTSFKFEMADVCHDDARGASFLQLAVFVWAHTEQDISGLLGRSSGLRTDNVTYLSCKTRHLTRN